MKFIESFLKRSFWHFISVCLLIYLFSSIISANSGETENIGVILISHGAPMPQWNQNILQLIRSVKSPYPLEAAFLDYDKERTVGKCVKRLEDRGVNEILLIHLAPSSYSCHHEEIKYLVGLRKDLGIYKQIADQPVQSNIRKFSVSPCMDDHPLVIEILTDYAKELSQDPEKESLVLLGHGPVEELENIMWVRQLKHIGKEIQKTLKFRNIVCMTLRNDAADLIRDQAAVDLREAVTSLAAQGKVIVLIYALGTDMLQGEVKQILIGIPEVAISRKGVSSHSKTLQWIESTISNGMNQPTVAPIRRSWSHMDYETGKPLGTNLYGN